MNDQSERGGTHARPNSLLRHGANQRAPALVAGTVVHRGGERYVAELVERHATRWVAGLVRLKDVPYDGVPLIFVPIDELYWEAP